jgi:hypothetical protein
MTEENKHRRLGRNGPWLTKREDTPYWYITWYAKGGGTKRRSTKTADEDEAYRAMAKWWVTEKPLSKVDPSQVPLGVVLDRYYEQHASKKKSKTQAKVARAMWKEFFKTATCADVTEERLAEFIEFLREQKYATNYIRRTLSVGRSALLRAVRKKELAYAPKVLLPKRPRLRKYRMTIKEAAALFNAATTDHFRTYLLLAFGRLSDRSISWS